MIIAVRGEKNSGKDLVGRIIQYLLSYYGKTNYTEKECINFVTESFDYAYPTSFKIKKFADLPTKHFKDLTGIDYSNLDREEKEKVRPLYIEYCEAIKKILGKDIWAKSLFKNYKGKNQLSKINTLTGNYIGTNIPALPNWVITDLRFKEEYELVKKYKGIDIEILRPPSTIIIAKSITDKKEIPFDEKNEQHKKLWEGAKHYSETDLMYIKPKYKIINNNTVTNVIEQVKEILIKEKLL